MNVLDSIGSFFRGLRHELALAAQAVLDFQQKAAAVETTVEAVTAMISPHAALAEKVAFSLLDAAAKAIRDGEAAGSANGLNVPLDMQTVNDVKTLVAAVQAAPAAIRGAPSH